MSASMIIDYHQHQIQCVYFLSPHFVSALISLVSLGTRVRRAAVLNARCKPHSLFPCSIIFEALSFILDNIPMSRLLP